MILKYLTLNENNGVAYLTFNALSDIPFIRHAFSTKIGEGSRTIHPMDMSFDHDDREAVTENYKRFCAAAGFDYPSLVASSQDHHTFVRVCTSAEKGIGIYREKDIESVDGLVTIEPGLTLCTYYADCTPLFFVDTATRAIGLAHGGWRGTVGRIAAKVVDTMRESFGTDPAIWSAQSDRISAFAATRSTSPARSIFMISDSTATGLFFRRTAENIWSICSSVIVRSLSNAA